MPYVPRVSTRRPGPKEEETPAEVRPRPDIAKLAAPDVMKSPPVKNTPKSDPPCTQCFKDGWPEDATSVGCEHGTWALESD